MILYETRIAAIIECILLYGINYARDIKDKCIYNYINICNEA